MGEVRLGSIVRPDRPVLDVVLKSSFAEMLNGKNQDDFWHEASMLSQIEHPHVVRLFGVTQKEIPDASETRTVLYLVMERCPKGSIADSVDYDPARDFMRHAEQIASTLVWLHSQGIVHRDIKPSNVLLDDVGGVKLCDLGLSRFQPVRAYSTVRQLYHLRRNEF
jgi:serine/threonine protein kinase